MKIEYKILWLDDKISEFEEDEHVQDIIDHLEDQEFEPKVIITNNQKEFYQLLDDSYDLILTDFHLDETRGNGNTINGDKIVEKIRKDHILTEILFYTAKADLKNLKWDRISFLETSKVPGEKHHEAVISKAIMLIDLTIKKFHDIVVMRGLIMEETSSLDAQKLNIIDKFISNTDNLEKTSLLKENILEKVDRLFNEKISKISKWKKNPEGMNRLISDNFVFSSTYKIEALSYILSDLGQTDFSSDYKSEIINTRNTFAHAELMEIDGKKYFKNKKENIEFDDKSCITVRKNIKKHKGNLDKLEYLFS